MAWHGRLTLRYRHDAGRTLVHDLHSGPLRVLQSLYPEGSAICHNVLVHPPGGVVGGDVLAIDATVGEGAHALITTPGATRFYRSLGDPALQSLEAEVASGARLEWVPLETIAFSGALAENRMSFRLAPGAETIGWDVLALGLPTAHQPFVRGRCTQHVELPGVWIERGTVRAEDLRLLDSPLGWDGQRVLATMWFAAGAPLDDGRRAAVLDAAREVLEADPLAPRAGATSPHAEVVLLRVLAPRVEPAMRLLQAVWARWRAVAWSLPAVTPRVWRT